MSLVQKAVGLFRPEAADPADTAEKIARKLPPAREAVKQAAREIDAASLGVEEGQAGASQALERAKKRHAEAAAEVDRLERAHRKAVERENAAQQAKQTERRREEARELSARRDRLHASVLKADAACAAFVASLQDVMRQQSAVAEIAPVELRELIGHANEKFAVCLTWRLRFMPGIRMTNPFWSDAQAQWAQYFPAPAATKEDAA